MNVQNPWNDYSSYIRRVFGYRVQKIAVDAGFSCPNRDGSIATGGCIYCSNQSFSPYYCNNDNSNIKEQLQQGINFFSPKYKTQKYLAYFQTYTNTYADTETCLARYAEALNVKGVVGLIIATRPDAVNKNLLCEIKKLVGSQYLAIEYGVESTLNKTLDYINRGHNFEKAIEAFNLNKELGITTGAHFILGLPGESKDEMMEHANIINKLPIDIIKLHQMQIIKGTRAAEMYANKPSEFGIFDLDSYVIFVSEFLRKLKKTFIIERFTSETPRETLVAPDWGGIKNFEVVHKIRNYMNENNYQQGDLYK
jgi:uncharacterized protein